MKAHPLLAALAVVALLLPTAQAGVLATFETGSTATLDAGVPGAWANLSFPNPSRAVQSSLRIDSDISFQAAQPFLTAAWTFSWQSAVTSASAAAYRQSPAGSLTAINAEDGVMLNVIPGSGKPGVLFEFAAPAAFQDPRPWNLTLRAAATADAPGAAGGPDFGVALYAPPGLAPWRPLALSPAADNASVFAAEAARPALAPGTSGLSVVGILFPLNASATALSVDSISVVITRVVAPSSPSLVAADPDLPIWSFAGPQGPARFGFADGLSSGNRTQTFASNGSSAGGLSEPLLLPANATVQGAFVEVAPVASTGNGSFNSAASVDLAPLSTSPLGSIYTPSLPIAARPTSGQVTLSDLTATGLIDARFETVSTQTPAGNLTTFERAAAQTFTAESDGTMTGVDLNFTNSSARPAAPLVVELRDVVAGVPGSTVLSTATFDVGQATAGGWVRFSFGQIAVTAGQTFAIVVTAPAASANQYWEWRGHDGVTSDPYSNGSAFISTNASGQGLWNIRPNVDWTFRALMERPFDPFDIGLLSVAGQGAPPTLVALPNNASGWRFSVPGLAVGVDPEGAGSGRWNATVVSALSYGVRFNWSTRVDYELYPRAVEVGVEARAPAFASSELDGTQVLDLGAELTSALQAGNYTLLSTANQTFWAVHLRVGSLGPASIQISDVAVTYASSAVVSGFQAALNVPLSATPVAAGAARAGLMLLSDEGRVVLSAVNITYSQPPVAYPQPPVNISEGAVNATVADLYQIFADDQDGFALNYSVVSILPALATASVYRSALDANLTLTMTDPEFNGVLLVTVRATDSSGLSTLSGVMTVQVVSVDDPPVMPAVLPELVLPSTTGSLDVAQFVDDNDTSVGALTMTASSAFATVNGLNLSFDYRGLGTPLFDDTVNITVSDGVSSVSSTLHVRINNAGRPVPSFPSALTIVNGRQVELNLSGYVTDDKDASASVSWTVNLVVGVGTVLGDATAGLFEGHTLLVTGLRAGDVDVTLEAVDLDGNHGSGVLHIHVVENLVPRFVGLDGTHATVSQGGPVRIDLQPFLRDDNDNFANFTFTVAWDNGTVVQADVENGTLLIYTVGSTGGHARVTITAEDPSGALTSADIEVDASGAAGGGLGGLLLIVALVGVGAVGLLVVRSRRASKSSKPKFSSFAAQSPEAEPEEESRRLESPEGVERTDADKMDDLLDEMERETDAARLQLPPLTLVTRGGDPAATSLLLLYRDGRPMAWVTVEPPEMKDIELEEEVAAAVVERLKRGNLGERIENETIEMGGAVFALEARAQLVMAARMWMGADEGALRRRMRDALDLAFDRNATALKRWNGAKSGLKGLEEALEPVFGGG